jgi:hypothetical protein
MTTTAKKAPKTYSAPLPERPTEGPTADKVKRLAKRAMKRRQAKATASKAKTWPSVTVKASPRKNLDKPAAALGWRLTRPKPKATDHENTRPMTVSGAKGPRLERKVMRNPMRRPKIKIAAWTSRRKIKARATPAKTLWPTASGKKAMRRLTTSTPQVEAAQVKNKMAAAERLMNKGS